MRASSSAAQRAGVEQRQAGSGQQAVMGVLHTPSSAISRMQGGTDAITDNWLFHAAPVDSRRILAATE